MTTVLEMAPLDELLETQAVERDGDCLYCECRPAVTFCGRYVGDIPGIVAPAADDDCPDCVRVDEATGCPCCGCSSWELCRLCEVEL